MLFIGKMLGEPEEYRLIILKSILSKFEICYIIYIYIYIKKINLYINYNKK